MAYFVEFSREAIADLEALAPIIQERILRKVRWLSDNFENVSPQALSANLSGPGVRILLIFPSDSHRRREEILTPSNWEASFGVTYFILPQNLVKQLYSSR